MAALSCEQVILVWPDGTWCRPDELEERMLSGFGDDYVAYKVADYMNDEAIEDWLLLLDKGGQCQQI